MARMTASDMVTMVRGNLGGETSETITDAMILRFINQAMLEIASRFPLHELNETLTVTTASGTSTYSMFDSTTEANVLHIDRILDTTNSQMMYPISKAQYTQYIAGGSSSGTPVYWFVDGIDTNYKPQLTFWPTPDGTYTITVYYRETPPELVTNISSYSRFHSAWDDSIVARASFRGWRFLGDLEKAMVWQRWAIENDAAAVRASLQPSDVPYHTGSIVGSAVNGY